MFAARLKSATPFLVAGLAGAATLCGYQTRYSTAVLAKDENVQAFKDTSVVIIGGGYGGIAAANKLKDQCKLTLIDARNAFHHNMGAQRSSVESGFVKKCLIDYEPTFGESFKRGKVVDISPTLKTVTLDNGGKVAYDELIIATGTGGPFPAKVPLDADKKKAIDRYEEYVKLVKDAMKIGVVGGGAVGVEIAGDIMEDYQDKADVYLIHPRENLVNDQVNESFQSTIKAKLTSLRVNMILGERVVNMDEVKEKRHQNVMLVTDKGTKMKVDLVIPCTGLKVNTVAYKNSLESIFMVLCCGRSGGVAQVWRGWVFGDWFASRIKGKNVFAPMQWKNMNQKMPED